MLVKTAAEILQEGLALVHYDEERQARASNSTNQEQFLGLYGSTAEVIAVMLAELQTSNNPMA
jgi:hypothetical protein